MQNDGHTAYLVHVEPWELRGPWGAALAAAAGQLNIAFVAQLLLGRTDKCIDILKSMNRIPEATFFARTYAPRYGRGPRGTAAPVS